MQIPKEITPDENVLLTFLGSISFDQRQRFISNPPAGSRETQGNIKARLNEAQEFVKVVAAIMCLDESVLAGKSDEELIEPAKMANFFILGDKSVNKLPGRFAKFPLGDHSTAITSGLNAERIAGV